MHGTLIAFYDYGFNSLKFPQKGSVVPRKPR